MKITYENEWERMAVHIDLPIPYEEDYQMLMLSHNEIGHLLKVTGAGREGESRYTFYPGESLSMEKEYSCREMKKADVEHFTEQFLAMVDAVKGYMLQPDHIILTPELIFIKDSDYKFCYLPVKDTGQNKSLSSMFHEMTEYFVKKLDYQDTEGIFLVYRLHKETLKENFDLRMILEECRREEEERQKEKGGLPDTAVFSTDDEYEKEWKKEMYNSPLPDTAREEHIRYGLLGKAVRKIKRGRWGKWEDLITEMDGQEAKGRL